MVTRINARNANMGGENPSVKSVVEGVSANMGVKKPSVKSVVDPVSANMGGSNPPVPIVLPTTRVQPVDTSLYPRVPGFTPSAPGVTMFPTRV